MVVCNHKNNYKIIAVCGKSSTGKSVVAYWLYKELANKGYKVNKIISNTTRPPRSNEMDGVDYHFCKSSEFVGDGHLSNYLEWTYFNNWLYGTPMTALDKDIENCYNIGVFNPKGIKQLAQRDDVDLFVVYLKEKFTERLYRSLHRESRPSKKEIFRRIFADKKDFHEFEHWLIEEEDILYEGRIQAIMGIDGPRNKAITAIAVMENRCYLNDWGKTL